MKSVLIDGVTYVQEQEQVFTDLKPYVVIRSRDAGVFAGCLDSRPTETSVILKDSRRIYYWSGAATLSELSQSGVKNVKDCKFPCTIPVHEILGVCEIIHATQEARASIEGVPVWKA